MSHSFDGWGEIIFHSQTHSTPHGNTGRKEIVRVR